MNIGIAGFGKEGKALYESLKDSGDAMHVFDEQSRAVPDGAQFHKTLTIPATIDVLYKAPGIPMSSITLEGTTKLSSLTNLFLASVEGTVIGITGTKGKSTVSSLVYEVLSAGGRDVHLVGNIGTTPLNLIKDDHKETVYVFEMSSFQCELLEQSPHIAVFTNFFPEHIDHHGTIEKYREAKLNIARFQKPDDVFINTSGIETHFEGRLVVPAVNEPVDTKLEGEHNQTNCVIALAVAREMGVAESVAREAIKNFEPLEHRIENIGTFKGITFYDDTLSTIPESTLASIAALPDVDVLIVGGYDRGISYEAFAKALPDTHIEMFIALPDTGVVSTTHISHDRVVHADTMQDAVEAAYSVAKKGVLLSPAATSFNAYKNYEEKSADYKKRVEQFGA